MTLSVLGARVTPYALPLSVPLPTPHGRVRHRRGFHLRLATDAGIGWGEAAPWPGFGSSEGRVEADLERLAEVLAGRTIDDLEATLDALELAPEARHAGELALLDVMARRAGVPLSALLFGRSAAFATSHTLALGEVPPEASCLKLKVSGPEDDARIAALRASHPTARLRLDAGGRLTREEAERLLTRFARHRIDLVEQPVACLEDIAALRGLPMRIAVDEGLRAIDDLEAIAEAGAQAVVVKPMFLGGLLPALRIARRAAELGLEVIVTNALESAIGRAGALHLAAGLPGIHGLGSALAEDVAELGPIRGDAIALPRSAGLGVRPAFGGPHDLPSPIASAAAARPSQPALITPEIALSHRELWRAVRRRAATFAAMGIAAGDRIGLSGARDHEWVVSFHALGWLGAEVAPLPEAGPERARLEAAVEPLRVVEGSLDDVEAPAPPERFWPLDEARLVVCSSGSTGRPKAVTLTTGQLAFSAFASAARLGLDPADRWLACLPLHHVGGLSILVRSAFYATTVILLPRFDVEAVSRAIDEEAVTVISLVPAMLARLLDHRDGRPLPRALRAILVGGAAMDEALVARCRALGLLVAMSWGMTEAASQIATSAPGELEGGAPPLAFARVSTESGRLAVRGPLVGGSIVTSDRGRIRAGRIYVTGRSDDVIVSGGVKIDPRLVERAIAAIEGVEEVAVVGVSSARWGRRPIAFVVAPGLDAESLRRGAAARLERREIPDRFVFVEALPRTSLGKIDAGALFDQARLDQAQALEGLDEPVGRRGGREALEAHEGVDVFHRGADLAVFSAQGEGEGDRAVAETLDRHLDRQRLAEAHRPPEVGLGVDERQSQALGQERLDPAGERHEELFESGVAVLESSAEKDDPRAIYLEKARRVVMNEGHDDDRR